MDDSSTILLTLDDYYIKDKIEKGVFLQGEKLKTEKEYQQEYGVSRDTIRKAFGKLENEDYIVKKTAVGTFVKYKKSNYVLSGKLFRTDEEKRDRAFFRICFH